MLALFGVDDPGMNEAGRKKLPNDSLTGLLVSVV